MSVGDVERIVKNRYGGQLELLDRDPRGTCAVLTLSGRKGEAHAQREQMLSEAGEERAALLERGTAAYLPPC